MPATNVGIFDFSGEAIKNRREACGLTREALAVRLVRTASTIRAWEAGERTPGPSVRPALAAALGIAPAIDAEVRDWAYESRRSQGLPAVVEDDAAAEEIARAL